MIKFKKGKAYKELIFGFSPLIVEDIVNIDENSNEIYGSNGLSYKSHFWNGVEEIELPLEDAYYRADEIA